MTAADLAAWLKDEIRAGRFVPGQRLVESDLCELTQASRTIVRRALQRLEGEGVVVIERYRGASVRRLDVDDVRNVYAVREVLEGLAARLAAASPRRALLGPLAQAARQAVDDGDRRRFVAANRDWHAAMLDLAGNAELDAQLDRVKVSVVRLLARAFFDGAVIADAERSQMAVTEAILAGDGEEAERRMRAHVRAGLAAVGRTLAEHEAR